MRMARRWDGDGMNTHGVDGQPAAPCFTGRQARHHGMAKAQEAM